MNIANNWNIIREHINKKAIAVMPCSYRPKASGEFTHWTDMLIQTEGCDFDRPGMIATYLDGVSILFDNSYGQWYEDIHTPCLCESCLPIPSHIARPALGNMDDLTIISAKYANWAMEHFPATFNDYAAKGEMYELFDNHMTFLGYL